ncbi:MAG: hypothetical protein U0271_10860 [Polyangiaceae bacterium]
MQHHRKTADNPVATRARSRRSLWLRGGLAAAVAGVIGASGAGGCTAPFDPQSLVNSVRVLSVDIDKPYPAPGDDITLEMTYYDGRETDTFTPVTIIWLAGCYNPEGDQYYGCYGPLGELFAQLQTGQIPPDGLIAAGPGLTNFTTQIPEDILSSLPDPDDGTQKVGLAYFFFLACAGEIRLRPARGHRRRPFPPGA